MKRFTKAVACLLATILIISIPAATVEASWFRNLFGRNQQEEHPTGLAPLVIDYFDTGSGNEPPGIATGWFYKIAEEKFNVRFNFISNPAGDNDELFLTRSAAGNLGDLIHSGRQKLHDANRVGLIKDITELVEERMPYYTSQFPGAINLTRTLFNEGRIIGLPTAVSTQSPYSPTFDGVNPQMGSYMRQDVYFAIGAPPINTLDDLLPVLKQMQEHTPVTESGARTYGFTIWPDWDGPFGLIHPADLFGAMYKGTYRFTNTSYVDPITRTTENYLDDDGIYKRGLRLYFDANQMGLMDPDAPTQNWDTAWEKSVDGTFMFSWWSWFGVAGFNSTDRINEGIGYAFIPIANQRIHSAGVNPNGTGNFYALGSRARDPERLVDFLDWISSPEGFQLIYSGPQGLTWDMINGEPVVLPFGVEAGTHTTGFTEVEVPEEWGGNTFAQGGWHGARTILVWRGREMNPATGHPYDARLWNSAMTAGATKLQMDWANHFKYNSPADMLVSRNAMSVTPAFDFVIPTDSSDVDALRRAIGPIINSASWRMIFAADLNEFNSIWDDMKVQAIGMGWEDLSALDEQITQDYFRAWDAAWPN
jgi:multiple sugar transport system substrate-binding protein/putative aldouronate transport system substrate-binding protein